MRKGSGTKWLVTLGVVVAISSQGLLAQQAAPPPLPPLPGMPPPAPQQAEVPKLPQLKTIPEIPPAKQVAAKDAPPQAGWMDKAKGLWARFQDKPKEVAKTTPKPKIPEDSTKPTTSGITLLPPPPIQPPVVEFADPPKVDPNIFAFDEDEKKINKQQLEEKPVFAVAPKPVLPPLPPVAKPNSTEQVSVPVLPNPVKKPQEKKVVEQAEKREIPDLAAISFPNLDTPAKPAAPQLPQITLPRIIPPPPTPEKQVATTPAVPAAAMPKIAAAPTAIAPENHITDESKLATIRIPAPSDQTFKQNALPPARDKATGLTPIDPPPPSIASPRFPQTKPGVEKDRSLPSNQTAAPEKNWIDNLTSKALEFKKTTEAKITGNDPNQDLLNKLTTKQMPPLKTAEKSDSEEKKIVAANKSELPPLTPPILKPEVATNTTTPIIPALPAIVAPILKPEVATKSTAPIVPALPAIVAPVIKQEVAIAPPPVPPVPEIPPLAKPEIAAANGIRQQIAVAPPPAPPVPEIPPQPKPEIVVAVPKTTELEQKPKTPLPLPELTLGNVKLPNDTKKPIEEAEKIDMPLEPKRDAPQPIITAEDMKPKEEKVVDADAFEFDELNNKGKKPIKTDAPIIADIEADDPAFKFWKGHNFKTQVLPDVLNSKEYASRNQHLPKAVYREDLEQSLFVAVARGDLNAIRAMLNNGVDVEAKNAIGDTPLVHAAINGQAGAVRVLLARGANPNNPNVHGNTAMQVAAERGREDIIDALFEMGAKATSDYRDPLTPLQSGVGRGFASVYNAMLSGENPNKKQLDERNRALQALADAGPQPRIVISQGMPGLSKQIIDEQSRKMPGEPLTFDELERKLAYQEYVRKTGDDPIANRPPESTLPKLISPAGVKASPVPIPYAPLALPPEPNLTPRTGYTPPQVREPIVWTPSSR